MKKCPFCAEEVRDEAVVCKHCTRDISASVNTMTAPMPAGQIVPIAVMLTGFFGMLIGTQPGGSEDHDVAGVADRLGWSRDGAQGLQRCYPCRRGIRPIACADGLVDFLRMIMTTRTISAAILACFALGCAQPAPPAATVTATAPPTETNVEAAAPSVARADALLADMERREAAYKEFERTAPLPRAQRLEDFMPRPSVTETRAVMISADAAPIPEASAPLSSPAAAQSEEIWKNRMRDAVARRDAAELSLVAAEAQVAEVQRFVRPDGKMSAVIADNLLRARESVTRAAAATIFARTQITNLEEEARRAGIPPGWLRP